VDQDPDLLQEVVGGAGRVRALGDHAIDVLAAHLGDQPMADPFVKDEAFDDMAVGALGLRF